MCFHDLMTLLTIYTKGANSFVVDWGLRAHLFFLAKTIFHMNAIIIHINSSIKAGT